MGRVIDGPCKPQSKLEGKVLEVIGRGAEDEVQRTYEKWNVQLRTYLRNVTGLRLSTKEKKQSVPVQVVYGLPHLFAEILDDENASFNWWLMDHHLALGRASKTLQEILGKYPDIQRMIYGGGLPPAYKKDICNIQQVITDILRWRKGEDWLLRLREINEDVFGAYFYRVPKIEIYWMPIALVAKRLEVSGEAMTVVVLTHELAHSYTHIGFDTDGDNWDTDSFSSADDFIVEGMAQFYTETILERLAPVNLSPLEAFERLLKFQSPLYTDYQNWLKGHTRISEVVRLGVIEARIKPHKDYQDFKQELEKAAAHLPDNSSIVGDPVFSDIKI